MKPSRLLRTGHLLTVMLALIAFSVIATGSAQAATEGPFWTVEGKKLSTNETREVTGKAFEGTSNPLILESEILSLKGKIECHLAGVAKGAFIAGGSPGTGEGVAELSDCTVVNNGKECKVKEPIKTKKIRSELVVSDENGHFGKFILVEADPVTGTEGEYLTLEFEGANCIIKTTEVGKGLAVSEALTDPTITGKGAEEAETTNKTQAASYLGKAPDEFTSNGGVPSVWLFKNGVFELIKITPLKAFGKEAKLAGTTLGSLVNGEKYGAEI
jgi:hypothetical protein